VAASDDPRFTLARRLRSLREETWPGMKVTQAQLASALGTSVPLISSWESLKDPRLPPVTRLEAHATFFATKRSVSKLPIHLPSLSHFTPQERARRDELLAELTGLRQAAISGKMPTTASLASLWRFPPDENVTIVSSELPDYYLRQSAPHTDPDSPDHVEMYRYADLDALFELHGHIRAVNPTGRVTIRTASELTYDDYTTHLVLLGGVDWNAVTADILQRVELPIRQESREEGAEVGAFVTEQNERRAFHPKLREVEGKNVLVEDVAHFYRGPSPFNAKRTVTICNGQYQRGTFGAVRALTDPRFRDRNEEYARSRFYGEASFSLLFRVLVVNGKVVTPDWTQTDVRLHEHPAEAE
jgi:transcriptional regulator with XRE-family HTH domain